MTTLREAAAELRRLHEAHDWQYKMAGDRLRRIEKLEAVNGELLKALRNLLPTWMGDIERRTPGLAEEIRSAIAKAEGK